MPMSLEMITVIIPLLDPKVLSLHEEVEPKSSVDFGVIEAFDPYFLGVEVLEAVQQGDGLGFEFQVGNAILKCLMLLREFRLLLNELQVCLRLDQLILF